MSIYGWSTLVILFAILVAIYFYLTQNFNYWKTRGIDGPKPIIFFGTFYQSFFKSMPEVIIDNTKKYGKIHGKFIGTRPTLSLADPEHIKDILIKDFHKFVDHNDFKSGDPLNDRSLFNLQGEDWKNMRSIISPTFSSGKMRKMHPIIVDCVKRLEDYLKIKALNKNEIELKKVMSNLTMDVIATCAFGTQIDVYDDKKPSDFVKYAEQVFTFSPRLILVFLLMSSFPKLLKLLGIRSSNPKVMNFFESAITTIISRRKAQKVKSNDYLQLMINAQNNSLETEEQDMNETEKGLFAQTDEKLYSKTKVKVEITNDDILSTSFLFFVAGYETTASLLSFLCYSLAMNEKCQQKLYEEVKQFNGNYDYETIAKMPYLEACVAETLRLYNPVPETGRMAAEEYTIGDTGITIPKGMLVSLDIQTLHHSPEYYPEPEKWSPERFLPENRDNLIPYTYMPFGIGPRNCVGMRFALMEAKTTIAHLVYKFRFIATPNTKPLTKPKKLSILVNYGALNVGIELRNK